MSSTMPSARACPCGGSAVPAMVILCPACGEVDDVLSLFADGIDPRFTEAQLDGMRGALGTLIDHVGPSGVDQATAILRDHLAGAGVRPDELYAVLIGASFAGELTKRYADDFGAGDAVDYAFGALAAGIYERLRP